MATADRVLMLKLISDVSQPTKQLKGLSGSLRRMGGAIRSWGKAMTGALVIGGIEKVVDSLDDAYQGFKEGEDAARSIGRTWRNLGFDADELNQVIGGLGDAALNMGFDDAEVLRAFNTYLAETGNVKDATEGVAAAMNLARARGIPFAKAVRIVKGNLGELGPELRRNKRQAREWARNHPLEVTIGKIQDAWENVVGLFSQGKIDQAFKALGGLGKQVQNLLFGFTAGRRHVPGLIDRFIEIGQKIVPAVVEGLAGLGAGILAEWNRQTAGLDWGKAIGDALANAVTLVSQNQQLVTNLGILAVSMATALAVADIFANALTTMFKAPALLFNGALRVAVWAVGAALGATFRVAMWTGEKAVSAATTAITAMIAAIPISRDSGVGRLAWNLGARLQGIFIAGLSFGIFLAISEALKGPLDQLLPGGTRLRYNPDTGRMERYAAGTRSARGGLALVGERGPELVRLPRGARVWSAGETAGMMRGGGGVTVNIYAGVGDPVEIGRQVDRVLRAYRTRAGVA